MPTPGQHPCEVSPEMPPPSWLGEQGASPKSNVDNPMATQVGFLAQGNRLCLIHSQLQHDPVLESLGLVVNTILSSLFCKSCKVFLEMDHVPAHIRHAHKEAHIHVNEAKLATACKRLGVSKTLPDIRGGGVLPQIEGLEMFDGIACTFCSYACQSPHVMHDHHVQCHPSEQDPGVWKFYMFFE